MSSISSPQPVAAAAAAADAVFHDSFPKSPAPCKAVAKSFFDCFNLNSKKNDPLDVEAGNRGAALCSKEKSAYDSCLTANAEKNPPKLVRVCKWYSIIIVNSTIVTAIFILNGPLARFKRNIGEWNLPVSSRDAWTWCNTCDLDIQRN